MLSNWFLSLSSHHQVNPFRLTTTLMEHAQNLGASLVQGAVTGLEMDEAGKRVTGAKSFL